MTTNLFTPTMQALLDCANTALVDNGVAVGSRFLAPGGPPAWDNCCPDGGQLWVRLVQVYPTAGPGGSPFPNPDVRPRCSPVMLGARLAVGVLRCSQAFSTEEGDPPTDATKTAEGTSTALDASILLEAILCCYVPQIRTGAWVVDRWDPLGPNGSCVGGEWQIVVGVDPCPCPEPS